MRWHQGALPPHFPQSRLHTLLTATFWMSFSLLGFSHLVRWRGINEDTKKRHKVQGWERLAAEVWNCRTVKLLCRHALPSAFAGEPWMPSLLFTITFIHMTFQPTFCLCCFFFFEGLPSLYNHNDNLACLVFMVAWLCFCYQSNKRSLYLLLFWRRSAEGSAFQYLDVNLSEDGLLFSSSSHYEQSNAGCLMVCWGGRKGLSGARKRLSGASSRRQQEAAPWPECRRISERCTRLSWCPGCVIRGTGWNTAPILTSRSDVPSLMSFHRKTCSPKAGNWGYV